MTPRYFSGKATDMGNVAALKAQTFRELCEEFILTPAAVRMTRESLLALPEAQQNSAKRTRYLVACTFGSNPSPRVKGKAGPCNLIALDVDSPADALRLLDSHWDIMLKGLQYVVYHTARSTKVKPRLRILVAADLIPVEQYPLAVERVAAAVGVAITRESLVVVQPMYLPLAFEHDDREVVAVKQFEGREFTFTDLRDPGLPEMVDLPPSPPTSDPTIANLDHFRQRIEGITPEDVTDALNFIDADCTMMQWIEVGAAIKHQFGEEGFPVWDQWSHKGRKYTSTADTKYRWDSLKAQTTDRIPKTVRSLFRLARLHGWANDRLAKKAFNETAEWLKADARSTEELFDHGAARIARVTPLVGDMERSNLIATLRDKLKGRGMKTTLAAITLAVQKLEIETERKSQGIPPWVAGLVYVTADNFFYRTNVGRKFLPEVINLIYTAPTLGEKVPSSTSHYLVKAVGIPQVENLRYDPSRPEDRIFSDGGAPYANTYRATYVKSDANREQEAKEWVERHVKKLVKEPEYQEALLDFLSYLVQFPGKKIRWAYLLQSTKGSGKTWLAELAEAILGGTNVNKLNASGLLDSHYNEWAYGSQLLVMEEIRVVGHNRHAVMDRIKTLITDDQVSLHEKYANQRKVPNITNYLLFTNYHDSLAIQDDERRYFVVQSPIQTKEHVAAMGGKEYFQGLYGQVKNNAAGLRSYFERRTISSAFDPNGRAVETRYMHDLVRAAASPLAAAVMDIFEAQTNPLVQKDVVSIQALRSTVESSPGVGNFSDQGLAMVLREFGYAPGIRCRLSNGERHKLWTRVGFEGDAKRACEDRIEML